MVDFEKSPWGKINKILTFAAVTIMMIWLWKWFGQDVKRVREESWGTAFTFSSLFSIGIAVACSGYLLWRLLDWLFWRKYFHDKQPPDEPMR